MEDLYLKGRANIAIQRNERSYFFRMFDAKLSAEKIKKRYFWQAYKKLDEKDEKSTDYEVVKKFIGIDTLKAIYKSTMDEEMGNGLQLKSQDDLIGSNRVYKQRTGINKLKSKEEHEELDNLNNNFSSRLEEITAEKGKAPVKTIDVETD
ncbi:hypothetical protein RhiirA5_423513 [Rhizophagus irregularis]|uniref:Uncharacterized protein n=1 Tax=Rhizophagus irregularis TaxID=588596 RepID=A0A2I1FCG5_9GLOM|nr:hypothetical protein RhiirA5_423513 [Rhizophagus irregularis]PKY32036.1 hypothetical protein RhiirB3_449948 [Rhizophagus irregularis]